MCGIAGVLYFNGKKAEESTLRSMTKAMGHRGPDAEGVFTKNQIGLGHRRLSIIDTSTGANQPFTDRSGNFHMVYNGEIYNYKEVGAVIPNATYKTTSDTEVVIESFAHFGVQGVKAFKGMFAYAVWDEKNEELYLVRDRLGVKPLYYYSNDQYFVFASEIRTILASGLVKADLNEAAILEFLSYQSVSSPETIIKGIKQLEAGHYMKVKKGQQSSFAYWDIMEQQAYYDFSDHEAVTSNIRVLLQNSVASRMVSDVPVGAFLSGGIDSSAVVALMSTVSNAPNTFNIAFSEKEFDESDYATALAKKFNTNHHHILLKPEELLQDLMPALNAMDTPSGDGINTYVVSKAVKQQGITVALSGIGGDELFAGYPFYRHFKKLQSAVPYWKYSKLLRWPLGLILSKSKKVSLHKLGLIMEQESVGVEDTYPIFRSVFTKDQLAQLTKLKVPEELIIESKINESIQAITGYPDLSQITIAELMGYTQQTLLKDTDQMGMAHALEIREPFFDHDLITYVLNIPDELKLTSSPKQLLVDSLGGLLPKEITQRRKQGFTLPWNVWMKNELRSFCETHINALAKRPFMNATAVQNLWQSFLQPDSKVRWMEVWLLVVLEYWIEKNVGGN